MKRKINYKLLIALPLLAIAAGAVTVALLGKFMPQDGQAQNIPTPAEMVTQFQESSSVEQLSELYTKKAEPSAGLDIINYTADNSYAVDVKATDLVQFEQNDKAAAANVESIKANAAAFLTEKGLVKKVAADSKKTSLYVLFDSAKTVCQLLDLPPLGGNGATLTVSCIEKSAINDHYATINRLLGLYTGTASDIANPSAIQLTSLNEGNVALSTANIYGLKSASPATSLIFAAVNDRWEYIGQRAITSDETQVDNSISSELLAKINDPKYNGFLQKYIK